MMPKLYIKRSCPWDTERWRGRLRGGDSVVSLFRNDCSPNLDSAYWSLFVSYNRCPPLAFDSRPSYRLQAPDTCDNSSWASHYVHV